MLTHVQGMCKAVGAVEMLASIVEKTTTDRALHAEVLSRFEARVQQVGACAHVHVHVFVT